MIRDGSKYMVQTLMIKGIFFFLLQLLFAYSTAPLSLSWQGRLLGRSADYAAAADVYQKILELWYAY